MSLPRKPEPAKLVIGLFMKDRELLAPAAKELELNFGPLDIISPWFPFDFTDYYEAETGRPLFRRMIAYKNLIKQSSLAGVKQISNSIEKKYAEEGKRLVNIDPGYMLMERFVLATGKNYTHRIYIGGGIYADLTLVYSNGAFRKLPWTYPDYASGNMLQYLRLVRNKYALDLKGAALSLPREYKTVPIFNDLNKDMDKKND